jgi:hypothetical protein
LIIVFKLVLLLVQIRNSAQFELTIDPFTEYLQGNYRCEVSSNCTTVSLDFGVFGKCASIDFGSFSLLIFPGIAFACLVNNGMRTRPVMDETDVTLQVCPTDNVTLRCDARSDIPMTSQWYYSMNTTITKNGTFDWLVRLQLTLCN